MQLDAGFLGSVIGGAISGVLALVAGFWIARRDARAGEAACRAHLSALLGLARRIVSPDESFANFYWSLTATLRRARDVRDPVLRSRDARTLEVFHRIMDALQIIDQGRRSLRATQGGCVDQSPGGQASEGISRAIGEISKMKMD